MKKWIFNLLICLVTVLPMTGCGTINKIFHGKTENTEHMLGSIQSMYQINEIYTSSQVDSLCAADKLPRNLNNWKTSGFIDAETNVHITRYMYIKNLNDKCEIDYIITPRGDTYVVSKRKIVTE